MTIKTSLRPLVIRSCKCQYQNEQKIENKNVQKINLALLVCIAKIYCF